MSFGTVCTPLVLYCFFLPVINSLADTIEDRRDCLCDSLADLSSLSLSSAALPSLLSSSSPSRLLTSALCSGSFFHSFSSTAGGKGMGTLGGRSREAYFWMPGTVSDLFT